VTELGIKKLCTSLKVQKYKNMGEVVSKFFKRKKNNYILEKLLEFSRGNPSYRKILARVVKSLKEPTYCVYLLLDGDQVVYVGKSKDLCSRLCSHAKTKDFNKVKVIQLADAKSQSLCENSLILKYRPKYNSFLDLKDTNLVLDFEGEVKDFKDWLAGQFWFTAISQELQSKLKTKVTPKGYLVFTDNDIRINFKEEFSTRVYDDIDDTLEVASERGLSLPIYLKQASEKLGKPELFSEVTHNTYKFGNFYITESGKWRLEGNNVWYSNVNLDKIIKDVTDSFSSVAIPEPAKVSALWFGKYRGKMFSEVMSIDHKYCEWLSRTLKKQELIKLGVK
jgi:hypothetical protein